MRLLLPGTSSLAFLRVCSVCHRRVGDVGPPTGRVPQVHLRRGHRRVVVRVRGAMAARLSLLHRDTLEGDVRGRHRRAVRGRLRGWTRVGASVWVGTPEEGLDRVLVFIGKQRFCTSGQGLCC